jgi:hypothetical protein
VQPIPEGFDLDDYMTLRREDLTGAVQADLDWADDIKL